MSIFDSIVGNFELKETLLSSIHTLSNTILFTGPSGIGKFTMSKALASAILCSSANKPCGTCSSCRKSEKNVHPDLSILDFEGKEITVSFARDIRKQCYILPNDGDKRVFIIRDIQNLNRNAGNALLKILEEPPPHVHFILTCVNDRNILSTIKSRCTIYAMQKLSDEDMKKELEKRFYDKTELEIHEAIQHAHGVLGNAIHYKKDDEKVLEFMTALADRNEFELYEICCSLEKYSREDFTKFLYSLRSFLHETMLNAQKIKKSQCEIIGKVYTSLSDEQIMNVFSLCLDIIEKCKQNVGVALLCTYLCAKSYNAHDGG